MMSRPLMAPEELKTLPKGHFVLAKTGTCPMRTQLPLFLKWGIQFGEVYEVAEQAARAVAYADRFELEQEIIRRQTACEDEEEWEEDVLEEEGTRVELFERPLEEEHLKCNRRHDSPPRPPLRTD